MSEVRRDGVEKSLDQCKQKCRDEKKKYDAVKNKLARSGAAALSREEILERCTYFDIFDALLGQKVKYQPRTALLQLCHGLSEEEMEHKNDAPRADDSRTPAT